MSFIGALIGGAIKRRTVVIVVTVIGSIFGLFAYLGLPRESNPRASPSPISWCRCPTPASVRRIPSASLVRPLETQLKSIEGLKEMNAAALPGVAVVVLEFEVNFDKEKTLNDVRAKVDEAGEAASRPTPCRPPSRRRTSTRIR